MTTTTTTQNAPALDGKTLAKTGGIVTIAAVLANAVLLGVATATVAVPAAFEPLHWSGVLLSSAVGAVGATVVYGLLDRLTTTPTRSFNLLAVVVLGLSYVPIFTEAYHMSGATPVALNVLGLTHVVVAIVCVWLLTNH